MANLPPTALDDLASSATELTNGIFKNIPIVGNAALCVDSLCTTGRAGINLYYSPNSVAKCFFGASCICGLIGGVISVTTLLTSFTGIPSLGWLGAFRARGFNRLGKYTLHMDNVTTGNITNATAISDLMS